MKAAAEAAQLVASGPVSPEQQGTQRGQGQAAEDLAEFQGKMKLYDQNHPEGAGRMLHLKASKRVRDTQTTS